MVRSCFSSAWRLFRGRSETTRGQYVFGNNSTPCYPGFHNFWSRDWVSDELDDAELGEDPAAVRSYALGAPLGWVPAPGLIGDPDCIENGERWPLEMAPTLIGGFDQRCGELVGEPLVSLAPTNPGNWCFWAEVIAQTYTDASAAMATVAAALGVPSTGIAQRDSAGLVPPNFVLNTPAPHPVVVVIAGTTSALQWLAQINYGVGPPITMGTFGTNPVWYVVSSAILNRMLQLAIGDDRDLLVVGHSLGAAVGSVLCARLRQAAPLRTIQLLTCGSPRPGDARLVDILRTVGVVTLQNEGDVVLSLPLNLAEYPFALQLLFGISWLGNSQLWTDAPNRQRIAWDGSVQQGAAGPGPDVAVAAIILWAFAGGNFPDLSAHLPQEYERRLCRPVGLPTLWVDPNDLSYPAFSAVNVLPNRVDPTNSPQALGGAPAPVLVRETQGLLVAMQFGGDKVLTIPTPVGGGAQFSWYSIVQLVSPQSHFPNLVRDGVPLTGVAGPLGAATSWGGSATSSPGFVVEYGGLVVTVPWSGDEISPALLSVVYDGVTLTVTVQTATVTSSSAVGTAVPATWAYMGGFRPGSQPTPAAEILVGETQFFPLALSAGDDASVKDYFINKWLTVGNAITTESGDPITTESGKVLVTE